MRLEHDSDAWWTGKKCTHGVFLDVESAFDKIWHKAMVANLNSIGIEGKLLNLFTSYLSNRQQVVEVDAPAGKQTWTIAFYNLHQ